MVIGDEMPRLLPEARRSGGARALQHHRDQVGGLLGREERIVAEHFHSEPRGPLGEGVETTPAEGVYPDTLYQS